MMDGSSSPESKSQQVWAVVHHWWCVPISKSGHLIWFTIWRFWNLVVHLFSSYHFLLMFLTYHDCSFRKLLQLQFSPLHPQEDGGCPLSREATEVFLQFLVTLKLDYCNRTWQIVLCIAHLLLIPKLHTISTSFPTSPHCCIPPIDYLPLEPNMNQLPLF